MQSRTIEIIVGIFMLIGLMALGILAIQVSGLKVNEDSDAYTLYADFENIGGLVARSKVTIAGVQVGQVVEIIYDNTSHLARVRMEIDEDIDNISIDTTAAILTEGLLGGKYIGLSLGAEDEVLRNGDTITDTQSAIVLEELIGTFLLNQF